MDRPIRVIAFEKMHGAGNDFIVIDGRSLALPLDDPRWIGRLCRRGTGIGAEGLIVLRTDPAADLQMLFFNPDGHAAELCGNGARCAARFACDRGLAPNPVTLATGAGLVTATVTDEEVTVAMPDATDLQPALALDPPAADRTCGAVHTGVPHAVVTVTDIATVDVDGRGRALRRHPRFQPAGANVNFVQVTGPAALDIRTYERGVEAESGACGTGAVAAALVMGARGDVNPPVTVTTRGGYRLTVAFTLTPGGATGITLAGPAAYVYHGTFPSP